MSTPSGQDENRGVVFQSLPPTLMIQSIGKIPKVEMTIPRVTRDLLILAPSVIRSLQ